MTGREIPIDWNGRRTYAWVPELHTNRDLTLDVTTTRRTSACIERIRYSSNSFPMSWQLLGRIVLRAEGAAS